MSLDSTLRLIRLVPRLHRWAVERVQARHLGQGLSLRQLAVLSAIRDGLASPSQVARRLRVTPAVVTGLVDRMERRGYVRREAEPGDRRRLRLVLTKTGLDVGQEIQQTLAEELAGQLSGVSPTEARELSRSLELLERTLATLEQHPPPALEPGEEEDADEPAASGKDKGGPADSPRPQARAGGTKRAMTSPT